MADEIHGPLTLPGARHTPLGALGDSRSVVLTSASKAFNLAGLKCAISIAGSDEVAEQLAARLPDELRYRAGMLGVIGSQAAFEHGDAWLDDLLGRLDANRRLLAALLAERLPAIGYRPPEASFLAWLDCRALGLGDDPAAAFLERGRVALVAGPDFGAPGRGFARLNLGTSAALITEAVDRMAAATRAAPAPAPAPPRPAFRSSSTSAALSRRWPPSGRSPSRSGPKATRSSRTTRVPDGLEHPPHLALAALVEDELDALGREPPRAGGGRDAVVERHALPELAQRRLPHRRTAHLGTIDPRDLERRVGQPVGQLAVVGQQDQARRVRVEPPHRIEPLAAGDERDDRRPSLRVLGRAHVARGLVERVDDVLALQGGHAAVDRDVVALPHVARRIADDLAADGDAPGEHELLRGPARGDAGVGEVLAEAHGAATIRGRWTPRCCTRRSTSSASPPSAPARSGAGRRRARRATTR